MIKHAALAPLAAVMLLCTGCANGMFYYPNAREYQTPAKYGLDYESVTFSSDDGTRLHGWFVPAKGKPVGTVVHFHGNAQNLTSHFDFVKWLPGEGFNVFTFDYRGYGKSEGSPGRQGVYEDSVAAVKYVKSRPDLDPNKLFILGQSLGGTNAIAVVGENKIAGIRAVAIESTFWSYRSIGRDKLARIPIISLLKWPLSLTLLTGSHNACDAIADISPIPIVIIHGTADRVVPYQHGKWLYEQAAEPKELWTIKGGRHCQAFTRNGGKSRPLLVRFFKQAIENETPDPASLKP